MFFVGVSGSFLPYILAIAFSWVVFGKAMFNGESGKHGNTEPTTITVAKQAPAETPHKAFHYAHVSSFASLVEELLCLRCSFSVTRPLESSFWICTAFLLSPEKRGPPMC
ncbi:MAG TPA: hypothetical protein VMW01_02915 [Williamwhitmania sp.]|nr:hypothetical protein [Williamwhitmania sp.]